MSSAISFGGDADGLIFEHGLSDEEIASQRPSALSALDSGDGTAATGAYRDPFEGIDASPLPPSSRHPGGPLADNGDYADDASAALVSTRAPGAPLTSSVVSSTGADADPAYSGGGSGGVGGAPQRQTLLSWCLRYLAILPPPGALIVRARHAVKQSYRRDILAASARVAPVDHPSSSSSSPADGGDGSGDGSSGRGALQRSAATAFASGLAILRTLRTVRGAHFLYYLNMPLLFYTFLFLAYAAGFSAAVPRAHPLAWLTGAHPLTLSSLLLSLYLHFLVAVVLRSYRRCAAWDPGYVDEAWYYSWDFNAALRRRAGRAVADRSAFTTMTPQASSAAAAAATARVGGSGGGGGARAITRTQQPSPLPATVLTVSTPTPPSGFLIGPGAASGSVSASASAYAVGVSAADPDAAAVAVVFPSVCTKCRFVRPERSAHCNRAGLCVARFDHYCPWIANAVGAGNHREFVVFLAYLATLSATATGYVVAAVADADGSGLTFPLFLAGSLVLFALIFSVFLLLPAAFNLLRNITATEDKKLGSQLACLPTHRPLFAFERARPAGDFSAADGGGHGVTGCWGRCLSRIRGRLVSSARRRRLHPFLHPTAAANVSAVMGQPPPLVLRPPPGQRTRACVALFTAFFGCARVSIRSQQAAASSVARAGAGSATAAAAAAAAAASAAAPGTSQSAGARGVYGAHPLVAAVRSEGRDPYFCGVTDSVRAEYAAVRARRARARAAAAAGNAIPDTYAGAEADEAGAATAAMSMAPRVRGEPAHTASPLGRNGARGRSGGYSHVVGADEDGDDGSDADDDDDNGYGSGARGVLGSAGDYMSDEHYNEFALGAYAPARALEPPLPAVASAATSAATTSATAGAAESAAQTAAADEGGDGWGGILPPPQAVAVAESVVRATQVTATWAQAYWAEAAHAVSTAVPAHSNNGDNSGNGGSGSTGSASASDGAALEVKDGDTEEQAQAPAASITARPRRAGRRWGGALSTAGGLLWRSLVHVLWWLRPLASAQPLGDSLDGFGYAWVTPQREARQCAAQVPALLAALGSGAEGGCRSGGGCHNNSSSSSSSSAGASAGSKGERARAGSMTGLASVAVGDDDDDDGSGDRGAV